MEGCEHVRQVQLAVDRSFLNPRTWSCSECGTTESVWACLLCSHVACGRSCEGHALKHFQLSRHPMAIEVNQKSVHCYLCNDYIFNDNSNEDIHLIRSLLTQVASQQYQASFSRSGRVIKPAAVFMRGESRIEESISYKADKLYTAVCHWRSLILFRAFNTWQEYVASSKRERGVLVPPTIPPPLPPRKRRRRLTPGLTGLRNLGNTCYMNAVLQSLGHLSFFRESFRKLGVHHCLPLPSLPQPHSSVLFNRQTTVECFKRMIAQPVKRDRPTRKTSSSVGLKGGGRRRERTKRVKKVDCMSEESTPLVQEVNGSSLAQEVHGLMRVMWSGKWAVVTPHAVLNAVWRLIPSFRGYTQQDSQEFLCEILDHLQSELNLWPPFHTLTPSPSTLLPSPSTLTTSSSSSSSLTTSTSTALTAPSNILPSLFEGQLGSEVTYSFCKHVSRKFEIFYDLSLDFPQSCQDDEQKPQETHQTLHTITLRDLFDKFTEKEELNEEIFVCDMCSRKSTHGKLQSIKKQLFITHLPNVLRLHLKRFRWSGRVRHKISTHVTFPLTFDLYPYYRPPQTSDDVIFGCQNQRDFVYSLSSVIVHHGPGLSSGHYTSYCWNSHADSWIHCNDNRIKRCSKLEVFQSQAYILFYTRENGCSPVYHGSESNTLEIIDEPVNKKRKSD